MHEQVPTSSCSYSIEWNRMEHVANLKPAHSNKWLHYKKVLDLLLVLLLMQIHSIHSEYITNLKPIYCTSEVWQKCRCEWQYGRKVPDLPLMVLLMQTNSIYSMQIHSALLKFVNNAEASGSIGERCPTCRSWCF